MAEHTADRDWIDCHALRHDEEARGDGYRELSRYSLGDNDNSKVWRSTLRLIEPDGTVTEVPRDETASKTRSPSKAAAAKAAAEAKAMEEADAQAAAEAKAKQEAEEKARKQAEEKARAEAAAKKAAEAKAKREAEAKAKKEAEAKKAAEEKARKEAEAKAEAEEKARQEAIAKRKAEERAREKAEAEAAAKAKREAEAKRRAALKARKEAEAKAKREAEKKAREEAKAKAEAEAKAKKEAEEKAKREAEAKAKKEAEAKAKAEAEEKARKAAEAKAKAEAEEKARKEAEAKAKREAEAKAKREAEEKARKEAEAKAKKEAAEKAKREAEEKAKAEAQAKKEAEEQAKRAAEEKAKAEADAKAKEEAAERAKAADMGQMFRRLIRETGPISLAQYMGESNARYYTSRDPLGEDSDFITAPEISQMFGELIGLWLADLWVKMGSRKHIHYVELGPGRGTLAKDVMRTANRYELTPKMHFVETSTALRKIQRQAFPGVTFHHDLSTLPDDAPLLIVANEFFDALPVHQLVRSANGWHERMIGLDDDRLVFVAGDKPMDAIVPTSWRSASQGSMIETSPAASALMAEIATRLKDQGGAALIIDYGPMELRAGSTLQAIQGHKKVDPLSHPGEADLTAHVDFEMLAEVAKKNGADVMGVQMQGEWLHQMGIEVRHEALLRKEPNKADTLNRQYNRLVGDSEMGMLFKVLGICGRRWPDGVGFD